MWPLYKERPPVHPTALEEVSRLDPKLARRMVWEFFGILLAWGTIMFFILFWLSQK
jgi:hypothetical protein